MSSNPLADQAQSELNSVTAAIGGDFADAQVWAARARQAIAAVTGATYKASAQAEAYWADDLSNPVGVAQRLADLPANLTNSTDQELDEANFALDMVSAFHVGAILRHDSSANADLRWEADNIIAGATPETMTATILGLCSDPRTATFMTSPSGRSLALRFGLDPATFEKVALAALAQDGTETQIRRSKALASILEARKTVQRARAGRDNAIFEIKRGPARKASTAMMA